MKRKLNQEDVPMAETELESIQSAIAPRVQSFEGLGLDARILQAIAKEKFAKPTPVQARAIPLILEGKDVVARAKTGSGKTAAYALPIIEAVLRRRSAGSSPECTSALILIPTRELAEQVSTAFRTFSAICAKEVRVVNLAQKISDAVQRSMLAELPDIVVTTPARAVLNLNNSTLSLDKLAHLVIDEADLLLSYGYEEDLQNIRDALPTNIQTIMMSATMTTEVDNLNGIFCKDPAIIALDDTSDENNKVIQYILKCGEDEKFLLVYVFFKLKLIKGKCIIFVGDIDRCYRLKLYFEQFGIKSCVLNSELPVNSRIHVVEEFNKNIYEIIIASDEHEILGSETSPKPKISPSSNPTSASDQQSDPMPEDSQAASNNDLANSDVNDPELQAAEPRKKKRKAPRKDKEYGISRGIDFKNVACVLNFDLPTSSPSYTHRIGRTARAGQSGIALSLVVPTALYRAHKPTTFPSAAHDEAMLAQIGADQAAQGQSLEFYRLDMGPVEAFRYRAADALRAVTRLAIRHARTRELRQELLQSEKLKRHFEEHPDHLRHLRHDGEGRTVRVQAHLKHVPEYLLPGGGVDGVGKVGGGVGFVPFRKESDNRRRVAHLKAKMRGKGKGRVGGGSGSGRGGGRVGARGRGRGKGRDPLRTFGA